MNCGAASALLPSVELAVLGPWAAVPGPSVVPGPRCAATARASTRIQDRPSGLRKADAAAHVETCVDEQDFPRHTARGWTQQEQRRVGHFGKLCVTPQWCAIAIDV